MADSFLDSPRRGNRDWPDIQLADGVSPLNRIYNDTVTVSADLLRKFLREETEARSVLTCTSSFASAEPEITLADGYKILLDTEDGAVASGVKKLAVVVKGLATPAAVAAKIAEAVNGWLPAFTAVALGDKLGIYTLKGQSAIVGTNMGWVASSQAVTLIRPGFPPECTPGTYHPQCSYLVLVDARLTSSTDTHSTFGRRWQVDLARLNESEHVDVEALLQQGKKVSQQVERSVAPPRQFLPWLKTITQTLKALRGSQAETSGDGLFQSVVAEDNLAAASKNLVHQEWDEPIPLVSREFDSETGAMREVTQEVVEADTVGEVINAAGRYKTVQQVDAFWAIRTTVQAAGLAGQAINGIKQRTYSYRDNYAWPKVLHYIDIRAVSSDPQDIYSPVNSYAWRPVWLVDAFNGPCTWRVTERWTTAQPMLKAEGGSATWTSSSPSNEYPLLPEETPMHPREIEFRGSDLQIFLPECLHSGVVIRDTQFFQSYEATTPTHWPREVIARVSLNPDQGGWLTRTYFVQAPNVKGIGSGVQLSQNTQTSTSFKLEWTSEAEPLGTARLTVASEPTLESGILQGYNELVIPLGTNEIVVTGATRGFIYYARVTVNGVDSNLCICTTKAVPELQLQRNLQTLLSASTLTVEPVVVGESGESISLTLKNIGLLPLNEITAALSGDDADMFDLISPPTSLMPGNEGTLTLSFSPTSTGSKNAELVIQSNAEGGVYRLTLVGVGSAAEIQVEQPSGHVLLSGEGVNFGTVTEGSLIKVFKIKNVGNALMRNIEVSISGDDEADYSVTVPPSTSELAAGEELAVTITFEPVASDDAGDIRTAELMIASNDEDENPFVVNLTGVYASPHAAGAVDESYAPSVNGAIRAVVMQADGKRIIAGDFTQVDGVTRNRLARLDTAGVLDATFDPNCDGIVHTLLLQPDGKLILGGEFTLVGGMARSRLARLDENGTPDSWDPVANGKVLCLALQEDGKVLAGGAFGMVGGLTRKRLVRLNSDGSVDGFNPAILLSVPTQSEVRTIIVQADGKILTAGWYFSSMDLGYVGRVNADGTEDTSFNFTPYVNGAIETAIVENGGQILLGGYFTLINDLPRTRLARLNADGTVADALPAANDTVNALILQTDGRVLVAGKFTTLGGFSHNRLARMNEGFAVESGFQPDVDGTVLTMALQKDGRVLLGGTFTSINGTARSSHARLYNDEATSLLFVESTSTVTWHRAGAGQDTEHVSFELSTDSGVSYGALGGTVDVYEGGYQVNELSLSGAGQIRARAYPTDGHHQGLFEEVVEFNFVPNIEVGDGDEVYVHDSSSLDIGDVQVGRRLEKTIVITNRGLLELNLTDLSVMVGEAISTQYSLSLLPEITLLPLQSVAMVIGFTPAALGNQPAILKIESNDPDTPEFALHLEGKGLPGPGARDMTFQPIPNDFVYALAMRNTDVVLGGDFTTVNTTNRKRLAQLQSLGQLITQTGSGMSAIVYCTALLDDGGILIGGFFTAVNGVARLRFAKMTADGKRDTTWKRSANDAVCAMVVQNDGYVILAGKFTKVGGVSRPYLARLTPTGEVDTSWNPQPNGIVLSLALQSDGKLLVGGNFYEIASTARNGIARLNTNGSIDPTFNAELTKNTKVDVLALNAEGEVLFQATNGEGFLLRRRANGEVIEGWPAIHANARSIQVQTDGKILVGNYSPEASLHRYSKEGVLDSSWSSGISSTVMALTIQMDGKVIVGGRFRLEGKTLCMARLTNDEATSVLSVVSATEVQWLRGGSSPEVQQVIFDISENGGDSWTALGIGQRIPGGWKLGSLALPIAGSIRARARVPGGIGNGSSGIFEVIESFDDLPVADLDVEYPVSTRILPEGIFQFPGLIPNQNTNLTLTLRNTGNAEVKDIVISSNSQEWSLDSLSTTTLAVGQTATAVIRFSPSLTGYRFGVLTIASSVSGAKNQYRLALRGAGVALPIISTMSAISVTSAGANIRGKVKPNHDTTTVYFEYRRAVDTAWIKTPETTSAGFNTLTNEYNISGLLPNTKYYYRMKGYNSVNTMNSPVQGVDMEFTTTA